MKLKIAISSCPNDTFMFDALLNKKIDTKGYDFDLHVADVEELNSMAIDGKCDVTKISFHTFFNVADKYQLLRSGAALGENCGPLIVAKKNYSIDGVSNLHVAIPGEKTTAKLLMDYFFGRSIKYKTMIFSDIESAVIDETCDAGLIIHETRFTYAERGLCLIADLGSLWETKLKLPIPLGGIVIKRNIDDKIKADMNDILRNSILYAFDNPESSRDFIKKHSIEQDENIIQQHINLYVNDYSKDIGNLGKKAVYELYDKYKVINFCNNKKEALFVSEF